MNEDLIKLFSIPNIVVKIPTIWLLKNSMINENILHNAHLMVRYKTIESYINNKNDWWDTYNRMQRVRVSQKAIIPRNKAENEQTFKDLIDNIKKNGFSDEFPIVINNKFRLIDGSHRLAIALFFKIPYVPVTMNEATISMDSEYSLNWFKENGFLNIVDDIVNTYKKILMEENNDKPIIIAEACCNHMGNIDIAKQLILAAKNNGADYIKFQKRDINAWIQRKPNIYNYPHPNAENSFGSTYAEHRKFLEFNINEHKILNEYCKKIGINYCCSVFDIESAKEIIKLNPKIIKIPSACNMNFELLSFVCDNFDGEIHLSLGMTKKADIDKIVKFFIDKKRNNSLVLYACTSAYPLKDEDVCLLEISYLKEKYSNLVKAIGYSGHHQGIVIDIVAYSLGANFIERHFTLDNKLKGTDQKASIVPKQLQELRKNLDSINMCLTYKTKDILDVELSNKEKLKW